MRHTKKKIFHKDFTFIILLALLASIRISIVLEITVKYSDPHLRVPETETTLQASECELM